MSIINQEAGNTAVYAAPTLKAYGSVMALTASGRSGLNETQCGDSNGNPARKAC